MIRVFLAALTVAVFAPLMDAKAASPEGYWLTEKKGVIVKLFSCEGDRLCGQTVWMKRMTFKDGAPRLDAKNPDPALRDRHWCGITPITGLKPKGDGEWGGGEVYDPKTGETFDFKLETRGDRVKVRGYLGVPLLGKSETWTKADLTDITFCTDTANES